MLDLGKPQVHGHLHLKRASGTGENIISFVVRIYLCVLVVILCRLFGLIIISQYVFIINFSLLAKVSDPKLA